MKNERHKPTTRPGKKHFAKYFRHWITGKIYYAADYGHQAWPIG